MMIFLNRFGIINYSFYICTTILNPLLPIYFSKMDIVSRLVAFRDYKRLSNSQFADSAGIPRPTLSQFLNGRNKRMSDDLTAKIHTAFPELNIMWLLFGEGTMLTDGNIEFSGGKTDSIIGFINEELTDEQINNIDELPYNNDQNTNQNNQVTANITEFGKKDSNQAFKEQPSQPLHITPANLSDPAKKIQSIMVFYSDSSFEIFTPSADK